MKDTIINLIDTLKNMGQTHNLTHNGKENYEWLEILLKNNPGLLTILITGLLLPIFVLYLTNRQGRKLKELEKELEFTYSTKNDLKNQEKKVFANLSKILFDVQQLHVSLSGNCVNSSCITNALEKFDTSIIKYHEEISDNLLSLSDEVIDKIYGFYKVIGQLKIGLSELNENKKFKYAHVEVQQKAIELADIIIALKNKLNPKLETTAPTSYAETMPNMRNCCGTKPSKEIMDEYLNVKRNIESESC